MAKVLYRKSLISARCDIIIAKDNLSDYYEFQACDNIDGFDNLLSLDMLKRIDITQFYPCYDIERDHLNFEFYQLKNNY